MLAFLLLVLPTTAFVAKPLPMSSFALRRSASSLHMFDAAVLESVATAAAFPTVFVGTGTYLVNTMEEKEEEDSSTSSDGEVDIYRDTLLRYAGYANEVGEAFSPLVPSWCVPASYGVAITYVIADTVDDRGESGKEKGIAAINQYKKRFRLSRHDINLTSRLVNQPYYTSSSVQQLFQQLL